MTLKIIACEVMKEELLTVASGQDIVFEFLPQIRHNHPEKLVVELQSILDSSIGFSRIVLGYGLCGGATKKLRAGDFILTIPRVHECIPLLLGSQASYEKQRMSEIGTLYMSSGWTNSEGSIIGEYNRSNKKYGIEKTKRIFALMFSGYKRVLYIRSGISNEGKNIQQSLEIAQLLKLDHQIKQGDLTYFDKLVNGPWLKDEFINIPPHGVIDDSYFMVIDQKNVI